MWKMLEVENRNIRLISACCHFWEPLAYHETLATLKLMIFVDNNSLILKPKSPSIRLKIKKALSERDYEVQHISVVQNMDRRLFF